MRSVAASIRRFRRHPRRIPPGGPRHEPNARAGHDHSRSCAAFAAGRYSQIIELAQGLIDDAAAAPVRHGQHARAREAAHLCTAAFTLRWGSSSTCCKHRCCSIPAIEAAATRNALFSTGRSSSLICCSRILGQRAAPLGDARLPRARAASAPPDASYLLRRRKAGRLAAFARARWICSEPARAAARRDDVRHR